ncbi:MAG: DUF4861 domain-containing protein [Tannerella sp.]|jgi:hypothetical protein|nr:DUF4861 domain-containing protein [Tannerella sp.]
MKKNIFLLCAAATLMMACSQEKTVRVTVGNPSDFDRLTEMVELPLSAVSAKITLSEGQTYVLRNDRQETVPVQITFDGKLIFQAGVKAKETAVYTLSAGAPQTFAPKTYGRFIVERKDDFAWENDRVAFRIYGAALVSIDGPSNGLDLWYKRTDKPVIDKWYRDELAGLRSYHKDYGEGQDDYSVGRSLGGGMMAPYAGNRLWLNENFIAQELLENGPLRTTFRVTYKPVEVNGKAIDESRIFSLDAGSQLTKVTQIYGTDEAMPVAAGIVKRDGRDAIFKEITGKVASLVYAEPESEKAGKVYVGMIFPSGLEKTAVDTYSLIHAVRGREETHSHLLGITTCQPGTPVTYYTGFGWSKFGFPEVDDFNRYIAHFAAALREPLVIKTGR